MPIAVLFAGHGGSEGGAVNAVDDGLSAGFQLQGASVRSELRHAIALTPVLLLTAGVSAQGTLSECAQIVDKDIRLECFEAVAKHAGNVSVGSEQKFSSLIRAGYAMLGAVDIGLTYQQYGDRVVAFSTEIASSEAVAINAPEKSAITRYREALSLYQDARTLWNVDIGWQARNRASPSLVPEEPVRDIVHRRALSISTGVTNSGELTTGLDVPGAIRQLWRQAEAEIRAGEQALRGKEVLVIAPPLASVPTLGKGTMKQRFPLYEYIIKNSWFPEHRILGFMRAGSPVDVVEFKDGWTRIRYGSMEGWVHESTVDCSCKPAK